MTHFLPRDGAGGSHRRPADPVYPPREDSLLLLPFARVAPPCSVLEVGAGAGLASLEAARRGARVIATDRNPHALRHLRELARAERLDVEVVRTDLAEGLGRFDRILANPPYLPTRPEERDPDRWHNLALDGGPDGCRVTARLVASLPEHLTRTGLAFVVVSSIQSPEGLESIGTAWTAAGGRREVVAERALEGESLQVWQLSIGPPRDPA
jgi:release factor glutamine methyltransferase